MPNWKEIADETLSAAGELRKRGYHRSSVSRAYYAAFSAVLEMLGRTSQVNSGRTVAHKALPKLITRHYGKSHSKSARNLKASMRQLYERRIWADYDRRQPVDDSMSLDAVRLAASILKACER